MIDVLPLPEARCAVNRWNAAHPDRLFVPWETAQECLLAYTRWQSAVARWRPPEEVMEHLNRHWEFARKIPDALLLILSDTEPCDLDD